MAVSDVNSNTAVVIPARNEESTVGAVVTAALEQVAHVLVVDNASSDGTAEAATYAGAEVLPAPSPVGLGVALATGLRHCFLVGYSDVATLDADGAHDPGVLPSVFAHHYASEADLTIGSRVLASPTDVVFPSAKFDANVFASRVMNAATGMRITDVASGLRVVSDRLEPLLPHASDYGFPYELLCRAHIAGRPMAECPIGVRYDAYDIMATRVGEIEALLRTASRFALDHEIAQRLAELSARVTSTETVPVWFGHDLFVMHPISGGQLYLIQRQNAFFTTVAPSLCEAAVVFPGDESWLNSDT